MNYCEIKSLLFGMPPVDKLEFVMELGRGVSAVPIDGAVEIRGCASRVQIARRGAGRFIASADSGIVRGIIAVLLAMLESGIAPAEMMDEFNSLNLGLGTGRMNGLGAMIGYFQSVV
ncbi:MAG: SufE family protein [Rickettsiales bacterium]|jgi:sulfur transfer protein SufE|nr:SufE family protein [Rickettsiales bacterium]